MLNIPEEIWLAVLGFWLIALIYFEVIWLRHKQKPFPRLLTHLRFAPIVVLFTFISITVLFNPTGRDDLSYFDALLVQHSKNKIRAYVYGNIPPEQEVWLDLYNDIRGGCLNRMIARETELYRETAREGSSNYEAAVRARSLRIRLQIRDYSYITVQEAEKDSDEIVRRIALPLRNMRQSHL